MARAVTPRRKLITTIAAWAVALIIFFPQIVTFVPQLAH